MRTELVGGQSVGESLFVLRCAHVLRQIVFVQELLLAATAGPD